MRYKLQELAAEDLAAALAAGQLDTSRIYINLPAGFVFKGAAPKTVTGLGDVIAFVVQPIAQGMDAVLHTNLRNCGGCQERKEDYNAAVPDIGGTVKKIGTAARRLLGGGGAGQK